uniref:Ig-like domain-containing protein n=1 Tax=Amphilophus citrinellus TaxID=61819 RepID=A0A3Q0R0P1_AMPCI
MLILIICLAISVIGNIFLICNQRILKTVQLGEPATLTCALPNKELSSLEVHWYKQSVGDDLKLILTMYGTREPQYRQEIFRSRVKAFNAKNFSNLTILKTVQEDEGIYHCGIIEWLNPEWSATYLLVKGNKLTVVQWPTVSDRVRPGDTTALQCLVLSDSENQTSTGDHDVFWFRVGSDKSHPSIIYTDRNKHNGCEKRSDLQNRCVYRFSKSMSSSDAGTYYCAVATCGEILFGNGTELKLGMIVLSSAGNYTEVDDQLNYAALNFSERKTRGRRKKDSAEDSVYSQVKC